jgi:hypothetical protein
MVRSFSGTHRFRPQCLLCVWGADFATTGQSVSTVEELVRRIDSGRCPRCAGPLASPLPPAGSRSTRCRCIPVCTPCGTHEALVQRDGGPGRFAYVTHWPHERAETP